MTYFAWVSHLISHLKAGIKWEGKDIFAQLRISFAKSFKSDGLPKSDLTSTSKHLSAIQMKCVPRWIESRPGSRLFLSLYSRHGIKLIEKGKTKASSLFFLV